MSGDPAAHKPASRPVCELRGELPATLVAIEEFMVRFHAWRVNIRENLAFPGELLLREALTNAAMHGCGGESALRILCIVRVKPGRLVIAVRDDGIGFPWREVWGHIAATSVPRGRGIEIFRHYASSVRFSGRGNGVTLIRRFQGSE
jgi:anti-sigma regulatory factor (Ser/Thr protein kinase)